MIVWVETFSGLGLEFVGTLPPPSGHTVVMGSPGDMEVGVNVGSEFGGTVNVVTVLDWGPVVMLPVLLGNVVVLRDEVVVLIRKVEVTIGGCVGGCGSGND